MGPLFSLMTQTCIFIYQWLWTVTLLVFTPQPFQLEGYRCMFWAAAGPYFVEDISQKLLDRFSSFEETSVNLKLPNVMDFALLLHRGLAHGAKTGTQTWYTWDPHYVECISLELLDRFTHAGFPDLCSIMVVWHIWVRIHISQIDRWIFSIRSFIELFRPVDVQCHGILPICPYGLAHGCCHSHGCCHYHTLSSISLSNLEYCVDSLLIKTIIWWQFSLHGRWDEVV